MKKKAKLGRVVHYMREAYDVYVGRPSRWGNPFTHKSWSVYAQVKVDSLEAALERYKKWIQKQPQLMEDLHLLKGKTLACWCKPKEGFKGRLLCHAQILLGLAHGVDPRTIE